MSYRIPIENLPAFEAAIAKLAKRAAKLSIPSGIGFERVGTQTVLLIEHMPTGLRSEVIESTEIGADCRVIGTHEFRLVEITGEAPRLEGWTLLAKLEDGGEAGNVISSVPGVGDLPAQYRTSDATACDHCRTNRQRSATFVVHHDDGRTAQVGRQCLRDFTGHQSPEQVARLAEYLAEAASLAAGFEEGFGGTTGRSLLLDRFLGEVASVIRQVGWVSRSVAHGTDREATADIVLEGAYFGSSCDRYRYRAAYGYPTEADEALAAEAIEWGRDVEPANDYLWNVRVVASQPTITTKAAGIAASMVPVYQRDRAAVMERKARAAAGTASQWVGTVGEKLTATLALVEVISLTSDYGVVRLHKLLDEAGNKLAWRASGASPWDDGKDGHLVGEQRTVTGTVKRHETWKGEQETALTRVTTPKPVRAKTRVDAPTAAPSLAAGFHPVVLSRTS